MKEVVWTRRESVDPVYVHWVWCPGCEDLHCWWTAIEGEPCNRTTWEYDGNDESPTVSPSLLVSYGVDGKQCHSFVKSGQWQFLGDCTHALAGQTVPMVPLDWWPDDDRRIIEP